MGFRVANDKTGNIYQDLIYSKGAYVLHMLEMQFAWAKDGGEGAFKNSMQQFVKEYSGKAATTEDWKASMERTMPKSLDPRRQRQAGLVLQRVGVRDSVAALHRMTSQLIPNSDGTTTAYLKLTQSNVTDDFVMVVPLYLQLMDGKVIHIAGLGMKGNTTFEQKFPLRQGARPAKEHRHQRLRGHSDGTTRTPRRGRRGALHVWRPAAFGKLLRFCQAGRGAVTYFVAEHARGCRGRAAAHADVA